MLLCPLKITLRQCDLPQAPVGGWLGSVQFQRNGKMRLRRGQHLRELPPHLILKRPGGPAIDAQFRTRLIHCAQICLPTCRSAGQQCGKQKRRHHPDDKATREPETT
jgi:hypothetical protein